MNEMNTQPSLHRELGVFGATMMGLGAIVGTGVFVSIGVAAGVAGSAVLIAIVLAGLVAACNALSSAQLAANHPVSGGTYEYGYKYLKPWAGFSAGWMFLCAKSASAATAALGFSGYLLHTFGFYAESRIPLISIAVCTTVLITVLVLTGIKRSNTMNILIVSITLFSLLAFVIAGLPLTMREGAGNLTQTQYTQADHAFWPALLQATALMFVAYTGYGRIATLSEEVRHPAATIPRAIVITLIVSLMVYVAVAAVAIAAVGAPALGSITNQQAAPLQIAAKKMDWPQVHWIVAFGAMTAMLGVLLNLILGLSRVLLAMGRRGDMPYAFSRLNTTQTTPTLAVIFVGAIVLALALSGNVKTTWAFSAFTVLVYYAITNLAAIMLPRDQRRYPRWIAWVGLIACLFLAFWIPSRIWITGLALLGVGLLWHFYRQTTVSQ